jgi:hypothetical protein
MNRLLAQILVILVLTVPLPLRAQQMRQSEFVVFIHAGPRSANDPIILQIAGYLSRMGFIVRAPDFERDTFAGPHVEYSSESASSVAQQVADLLTKMKQAISGLSPDERRPLRVQQQLNTKNPPGYLGVWLF